MGDRIQELKAKSGGIVGFGGGSIISPQKIQQWAPVLQKRGIKEQDVVVLFPFTPNYHQKLEKSHILWVTPRIFRTIRII